MLLRKHARSAIVLLAQRGCGAYGLADNSACRQHAGGCECDIACADRTPSHKQVANIARITRAERNAVRQSAALLPERVRAGRRVWRRVALMNTARNVNVNAPAAVSDIVVFHLWVLHVPLLQYVIANQSAGFALVGPNAHQ